MNIVNHTERRVRVVAILLVLAVAAIYGQTAGHQFLNYDDPAYISANPIVKNGFTLEGIRAAFGFHVANWHPLTWFSHMLDCEIFGLEPGGHHLMSAAIHAANGALLLAVLVAMTGAFWPSAVVAAIFVVHPLRVESVAWAAERKDVLSALFWMLAMKSYLRYVRQPRVVVYLLALGLFALGLMTKPMVITLPFVLLLLDFWPLGRMRTCVLRPAAGAVDIRRSWWLLVLEKTPFLVLSLISAIVTFLGQTRDIVPIMDPPAPGTRLANAVSTVLYLRSLVWPDRLAPLYPYPRAGIPPAEAIAAAVAILLATAAVLHFGRRRPYLPVGWFWYLGTLVPVIGFVQVGAQARSDRYTYLPLIGATLAIVWLAFDFWPRGSRTRRALSAAVGLALVLLGTVSFRYVARWRDSITLFEHTTRVTRDNYIILNNLGTALLRAERYERAAAVLQEALRINADYCNVPYNLGTAYYQLGRYPEALARYQDSLLCYERGKESLGFIADNHFNIGNMYLLLGRPAEAEREFRILLHLQPDYPGGRAGLDQAVNARR